MYFERPKNVRAAVMLAPGEMEIREYPFPELISHRMSLDEVVTDLEIVQDPNRCMKVEVVPHAQ